MQGMMRTQSIAKGAKFSDQAQLNAQLGLELGLYAQNKPERFSTLIKAINGGNEAPDNIITNAQGNTISWKTTDQLTGGEGCYETDWTQSPENTMTSPNCNKRYFVYPYPGTGTVGGKDCDIKTQPLRKNNSWLQDMYYFIKGEKYSGDITNNAEFIANVNGLNALDHPCLWNTLKTGVSAEIPLFRIDSTGKEIGADTIADFYVRARLPCKSGSACVDDSRWTLQIPPGKGDIGALIWNIVTNCESDALCYLSEATNDYLAKHGIDTNNFYPSQITYTLFSDGLNILNNVILAYKDNKPIVGVDGTKDQNIGSISDFLNNKDKWLNAKNSRPFFHLSIAAPLPVSNGAQNQTVDSIEYQIIYKQKDATKPPLITNPTVVSQGSSGGYTVSLQSSLTKQTGSFNFSLVGK